MAEAAEHGTSISTHQLREGGIKELSHNWAMWTLLSRLHTTLQQWSICRLIHFRKVIPTLNVYLALES